MPDIIIPSSKWRAIAMHEASHVAVALMHGGELTEIRVNPSSMITLSSPLAQAVYQPKHRDPHKLMQTFAAGPVGENLFFDFSKLPMNHITMSLDLELKHWLAVIRENGIGFETDNLNEDWITAQVQARNILSVDKIAVFTHTVANQILSHLGPNDISIPGDTVSSSWPANL